MLGYWLLGIWIQRFGINQLSNNIVQYYTKLKEMKKTKRIVRSYMQKKQSLSNKLKMPMSEYSQMYRKYLIEQYPAAQVMIKKIVQMPACREYYLKFPLEGLLKGAVKKMMLNTYELGVFGFFLEQIQSWSIGSELITNLYEIFPDIIHVNEPTDPQELKELSIFLYLSSYSVKEFLNNNIHTFRKEMQKVFPDFEHLHTHWVNSQSTVHLALNPRELNQYFKKLQKMSNMVDYNTCVDKIIQISPCYDLSGRPQKKKIPQFGYIQQHHKSQFINFNNLVVNNDIEVKHENDQVDLMGDFKFDGEQI